MPVDYSRYPDNWKEISKRIREDRAGNRCECTGECGLHPEWRCEEINGQPAKWARGKIILTVAHLGAPKPDGTPGDPHDKMDIRDENLKAMCQRCHLRVDIKEHVSNGHKTRLRKRAVGPLPGLETA